jgi:hypothetical protein
VGRGSGTGCGAFYSLPDLLVNFQREVRRITFENLPAKELPHI